ncbi:MAG: hypothetical protein ACRD4H_08395 [Candidatus Acidiferrales bacterium]
MTGDGVGYGIVGEGIFAVVLPLRRVLSDVEAGGIKVSGGADDVFVVVSLPNRTGAMKDTIDGSGGERFEGAQSQSECRSRFRRGAACCARGRKRPEE